MEIANQPSDQLWGIEGKGTSRRIVRSLDFASPTPQEQKERRKLGKLSPSLCAQLRACNLLQLKAAKTLCNRYAEDQKVAPAREFCARRYTEAVLVSISLKNKRYQLEIRNRPHKQNGRIYFNGPYLYAYYRDGKYIREEYFKKDQWKNLPRKVRAAIKPFRDPLVVDGYFDKIKAKYTSTQS